MADAWLAENRMVIVRWHVASSMDVLDSMFLKKTFNTNFLTRSQVGLEDMHKCLFVTVPQWYESLLKRKLWCGNHLSNRMITYDSSLSF